MFGVSHGVTIKMMIPDVMNVGSSNAEPVYINLLGIPVVDDFSIKSVDDIAAFVEKIKTSTIRVMNDFDVPWVTQTKVKFPKVKK